MNTRGCSVHEYEPPTPQSIWQKAERAGGNDLISAAAAAAVTTASAAGPLTTLSSCLLGSRAPTDATNAAACAQKSAESSSTKRFIACPATEVPSMRRRTIPARRKRAPGANAVSRRKRCWDTADVTAGWERTEGIQRAQTAQKFILDGQPHRMPETPLCAAERRWQPPQPAPRPACRAPSRTPLPQDGTCDPTPEEQRGIVPVESSRAWLQPALGRWLRSFPPPHSSLHERETRKQKNSNRGPPERSFFRPLARGQPSS